MIKTPELMHWNKNDLIVYVILAFFVYNWKTIIVLS